MMRTFAADGSLVHDPATGLTHRANTSVGNGRVVLADTTVARWPVASPDQRSRSMPASLCWSPIVRCNLSCPQCLDDVSVPEANPEERRRIAAVLAGSGLLGIDISGGEPLLLRDLGALATMITDGGRSVVSVTTNGWHLERRAHTLAGRVDAVRVSLDGPDVGRHDRIRGSGSFDRAAAGIRAARSAGLPVQIQTVFMRRTRDQLQQMTELAAAFGANGLTILQMLPIGAGAALTDDPLPDLDAEAAVAALDVPAGLHVRLRTRALAAGFTIVRADGNVYRNDPAGLTIGSLHPLRSRNDLVLTSRDGNA